MLSAIVLGLGLAFQPALHQQVDYVSPNPPTCLLEQNLSPFRAFSTGMAFFEKAEQEYSAQDYGSAVTCFNRVLGSPDGNNLWRESSYYSARALFYGTEPKNTEEAASRFRDVVEPGIKDDMSEFSLYALWKITYIKDMEDGIFDSSEAEYLLRELRMYFSKGWYIGVAEEEKRSNQDTSSGTTKLLKH